MSYYENLLMHESYRALFAQEKDSPNDDSDLTKSNLPDDELEDDEELSPDEDDETDDLA